MAWSIHRARGCCASGLPGKQNPFAARRRNGALFVGLHRRHALSRAVWRPNTRFQSELGAGQSHTHGRGHGMRMNWVRFEHDGGSGFGQLDGADIIVCAGDMFAAPSPTGERVPLADVRLLTPCAPTKMIGLWNNFAERAAKEGLQRPAHPLYFLKANSCFAADGTTIRRPNRLHRTSGVRSRTRHRYRPPLYSGFGRSSARVCFRLHRRQRCHRPRSHAHRSRLCGPDARQKLRHLRRSARRLLPGSIPPACGCVPYSTDKPSKIIRSATCFFRRWRSSVTYRTT